MRRILALLFVCAVTLLMQGQASWAHGNHAAAKQVASASQVARSNVTVTSSDESGCQPGRACCRTVCAQCQTPRLAHRGEIIVAPFKSVPIVIIREERVRSVVVGRDPPVPKAHLS